ncbi:hypothetical protein [Glycomyces salinus]|uniref:hypothetical protein n=1 Tax=Glycomyces salinus TaxID=980294 RepID=UPI0018EABAC6|nr:hypothetical protein [Glycomyces salinus]
MSGSPESPGEPALPYGERYTWGYLATAVVVISAYVVYMLVQLADTPVDEIGFQKPLLVAIGASIVLNMFFAPQPRKGRDRRDERDTLIARHGERIGFMVLAIAFLGPFTLVMFEVSYFWIANAIYLAYCLSAIVESVVKIVGYRRGF